MGSLKPYYRRRRPAMQRESDFLREVRLRNLVARVKQHPRVISLRMDGIGRSVREMMRAFPPLTPGSVRAVVANMLIRAGVSPHIDLRNAHLEPYGGANSVNTANSQFDKRAAAAVFCALNPHLGILNEPFTTLINVHGKVRLHGIDDVDRRPTDADLVHLYFDRDRGVYSLRALLEIKIYNRGTPVYHPTFKTLAAMAYGDFFPGPSGELLRARVSTALARSAPGWCGTFGPGVDAATDLSGFVPEGNYDMSQQHMLRTAYAYFNELTPSAREHLVRQLLANGLIHRPGRIDSGTAGPAPNDWARAGFVSPLGIHKNVGETENHVLMIHTARYLSNQLMYQRYPLIVFDNRRNRVKQLRSRDDAPGPTCLELVMYLLRNILLDDFSEYNAKSYQHETRSALLNLYNFAYDREVRLGARMVLDYLSARLATSSNDCRRLVPFRRRNEGKNSLHDMAGHVDIGLIDSQRGSDPMTQHMALLSGATRAYEVPSEPFRPLTWSMAEDGGNAISEALSDYRLPTPIHDLFVNDQHRLFYQELNRRVLDPVDVTGRNAVNSEIYCGSPSYMISAGGHPALWAIDPTFLGLPRGAFESQLGVAVPSAFMPTGESAGNSPDSEGVASVGHMADARSVVQVGRFSHGRSTFNYGVAPDFLCGPNVFLPRWCTDAIKAGRRRGKFDFVNKRGQVGRPGFYLAILRDRDLAVIEAFDTWLNPQLPFEDFCEGVSSRNQNLDTSGLSDAVPLEYTTHNGNRIRFMMFSSGGASDLDGALVLSIHFANRPEVWVPGKTEKFLAGTVLNSSGDGVITISNPALGQTITLDLSDPRHPRRVSENNEVETAGSNEEVWVDFAWKAFDPLSGKPRTSEGDFFRPFTSLKEGVAAVADNGVVKIVPGHSSVRGSLAGAKRFRITAPIGDVRIGE